nr:RNA-directed DNA polymerase, eukaryota, reverse transcriptase zinc-binding domain protein [Tanacetum cinerariifolium]
MFVDPAFSCIKYLFISQKAYKNTFARMVRSSFARTTPRRMRQAFMSVDSSDRAKPSAMSNPQNINQALSVYNLIHSFIEASSHLSPTISLASSVMPLISSMPPFVMGGVGGRLVMLVSLGGRLFELMLSSLSRFGYLLAVFGLDKLQVNQCVTMSGLGGCLIQRMRTQMLVFKILIVRFLAIESWLGVTMSLDQKQVVVFFCALKVFTIKVGAEGCPYKSAPVKVWRFVPLIIEVLEEAIYLLEDQNIFSYMHQKLIVTTPWKEAQLLPSTGPGSPLSIVCDNEIILTRSIFHRTAKASLADNRTTNWRRLTCLGNHTQYPSWNKLTRGLYCETSRSDVEEVQKISTSIFFMNFPDQFYAKDLWKVRAKEVSGWIHDFVIDDEEESDSADEIRDEELHDESAGFTPTVASEVQSNAFKKSIMKGGECLQNIFDDKVASEQVERYDYVFNVQGAGAGAFNSFISVAGLKEVPLGGCSFTWCHKSATKMSKLVRFLISKVIIKKLANDEERNVFWNTNEEVRESQLNMKNMMYHSRQILCISRLRRTQDHCLTLTNTSWCGWTQSYLRSSRGSVIMNGSPTHEFQFHRGRKQGDPLSPFLFILIMESLHILVQRVMDAGMFRGISMGVSLHLSRLFYAYDVVFMGHWSDSNIDTITTAKIGYATLEAPFSYLGSEIVNNLVARLSNWKMKTLSIGGRLTLLKLVLEKGGLGVLSFYVLNRALLFKWVWRFRTQGLLLWARVIKGIHGEDGKLGKNVNHSHPSIWLDIVREMEQLKNHDARAQGLDGELFRAEEMVALHAETIKHVIEGDCANPTKDKVAEEELKIFMLILLKWIRRPCLILFWDDTEEIRKTFNIKNDLTPEEEEGVMREHFGF